jgi:hypothetical protein
MISLLFAGGFFALLLAGVFGAWVGFGLGLDHAAAEGRHRAGSPRPSALLELPRAGRLPMVADPFAEPVGAAEYRLLTAPAEVWADRNAGRFDSALPPGSGADLSGSAPGGTLAEPESDTAFTRRQAAMVEAMIAEWEAQGNYDRHLIQARR